MPSFGLAFPVLAGKEAQAREVGTRLREQRAEYEQSRQRVGVSFERAYLQRNPDGTSLVVGYLEAGRGFGEVMQALLTSDLPLDRYFIDKNQEVTGLDFRAGPAGSDPELVGEYVSGAGPRGKGLAFAAPLQPGKTDAARQFAREAYVSRRAELAESRSAKGLTREAVFLNQTPNGDVVVVYLEGTDPVEGNRQFAASSSPFDRWFKDRCKEIFPPYIDFDQPVPPNEEIFSSV
jgi:Family of unknown function (DUF6176)